jgi:hypothetical protein
LNKIIISLISKKCAHSSDENKDVFGLFLAVSNSASFIRWVDPLTKFAIPNGSGMLKFVGIGVDGAVSNVES